MGGLALTVEGLKDLAEEALSTYANVEKATIALSALTGSGEQATEAIESLKTLALTDALSFPTLVTAYQRMVAFGFATEQIPGVLQAAADAAAATGRNIDQVTNAIDRMALSGTVGARQLANLGVSLQDLGAAMDVTASEASAAFKALDTSDRLLVIEDALQKYQGVAESVAQGVAGQFQNLKTQTEFVFESIGEAIAPAAEAIMGFASKAVLPTAQLVANAFADMGRAETDFASTVAAATPSIITSLLQLSGVSASASQVQQALSGLGAEFKEVAQGAIIDAFVPGLRIATSALNVASLAFQAFLNVTPGAAAMAQQMTAAFASMGTSIEYVSKSAQAVYDNIGQLNTNITQAKADLDDLKAAADGSTQSLQAIAAAENNVTKAQAALNSAMGVKTVNDYKTSVDGLLESFAKAQTTFANAQTAFQKVNQAFIDGSVNAGQYLEAYNKVQSAAKAAGQSFSDVDAEVTKLTQHVTDQTSALDTSLQVYNQLKAADIPGTEIATADAFTKVQAAAKALGIEVTNTAGSLQFAASGSKVASDAVAGLVEKFNELYGVQLNTVIVNGKATQTLLDLADQAAKTGTATGDLTQHQKDINDAWRDGDIVVQRYNGDVAQVEGTANDASTATENLNQKLLDEADASAQAAAGTQDYINQLEALASAADDAASAVTSLNSATSGGKGSKGGVSQNDYLASAIAAAEDPASIIGQGITQSQVDAMAQELADATGQVVTTLDGIFIPAAQRAAILTQAQANATAAQTTATTKSTTSTSTAATTTDTNTTATTDNTAATVTATTAVATLATTAIAAAGATASLGDAAEAVSTATTTAIQAVTAATAAMTPVVTTFGAISNALFAGAPGAGGGSGPAGAGNLGLLGAYGPNSYGYEKAGLGRTRISTRILGRGCTT